MENNSTLEKILFVFNRNAELLRLVGATFDSKVASLRRVRKKNLIILRSLQKRKLLLMAIFCFICFVVVYIWVVKYQLKLFWTYLYAHWTYLWQCCIWNFSQYNNLSFIAQELIEILYEILLSILAFIEIYAIKVSVWTRYYSYGFFFFFFFKLAL